MKDSNITIRIESDLAKRLQTMESDRIGRAQLIREMIIAASNFYERHGFIPLPMRIEYPQEAPSL